jgi:hypothetical protein
VQAIVATRPAVDHVLEDLEGGHYSQVAYNFYGVRVRIRTDSPGAVSRLDSIYGFFSGPEVAHPHLDMTLLVDGGDSSNGRGRCAFARVPSGFEWRTAIRYRTGLRGFEPLLSNIQEMTVPPHQEAGDRLYYIRLSDFPAWSRNWLTGVEYLVTLFLMYHLPHLFWVHAGTMSHKGRGLLLCGSPESGKSTLSYALARRGFGYLSDEFALFAPASLEVFPFPRGISFKPNVVDLLPELGPILEGEDVVWRQEKRHLMSLGMENLGFQVMREPVKVAFLFFVNHQASAVPRLKRVAASDAAEKLVGNCWVVAPPENRSVIRTESAMRLCGNAVCAELLSGDLDETIALVTSVLESGL